ncbi:uncharacterized protein C15H16orf87 isoform X1, partial [Canis lupus familiaris]|uniref:uncharacterized protein C15H16orf87 isoform X1 n=1 Tax=Canis lupus familiaris TaxID=9615 RepID=UPI0018F2B4BB
CSARELRAPSSELRAPSSELLVGCTPPGAQRVRKPRPHSCEAAGRDGAVLAPGFIIPGPQVPVAPAAPAHLHPLPTPLQAPGIVQLARLRACGPLPTPGRSCRRSCFSPRLLGTQVPVACKSCPCGYVFINRKLLIVKHSEKSSPFTEVNSAPSLKDLRILFLYEFKLGHSAATASRNINSVFGKGSVSERTIRWWFEKFRSGDLSLKNEPRGRPKSVLNEDQLRAMVEANPKTAIRGLAADLGVSATTISRHLAAIGKVKKLDKWVGNTN